MIVRNLVAALAVVAIPLAVAGHAQVPTESREDTKKVCEVDQRVGSRLGGVRRCLTRAERIQQRADSQKMTERIQSQKNFSEEMYRTGTGGMCRGANRSAGPRGC